MTKLNQILSKPTAGWSTFTLEDFTFGVSYLRDTPQEIIDALVGVIGRKEIRVVELDSEGEECLVVIYPYSGIYTIINRSDNDKQDNNIVTRYFPINNVRLAKRIIEDIELHWDDWAEWQSFGDIELKKYYDLSELKKLITQ